MLHCNVQYLHDQLIPFAAVINLIIVAWDDAAGKLMVIPINCMVTMSSATACVGAGIEAGNLLYTGSSVNTGCCSAEPDGNSETICSRIFLSQ